MFRCGMSLLVAGLLIMGGRADTGRTNAVPGGGSARLAGEARLTALKGEFAASEKAFQERVASATAECEKEEADLRQALEESKANAESLRQRILKLEAENLALSNDTVAIVGRLRNQLRMARSSGASASPASASKAGDVVDRACQRCRGAGTVSRSVTCDACDGRGSFARTSGILRRTGTYSTSTTYDRCASCKGKGRVQVKESCPGCGGSGRVSLDP